MEPIRGIIIQDIQSGDIVLRESEYVWILGKEKEGIISIETKGKHILVPADAVIQCPVPPRPLMELKEIDKCFGESDDAFVEEYKSIENFFRILRCKRHGKIFLEDVRGGIAMYSKIIYVGDSNDEPREVWRKYHSMSTDWLNYLGIAL